MTIVVYKEGILASDSLGVKAIGHNKNGWDISLIKKIYVSGCRTFAWAYAGVQPDIVDISDIELTIRKSLWRWGIYEKVEQLNYTENSSDLHSRLWYLLDYLTNKYDNNILHRYLVKTSCLVMTKHHLFDVTKNEKDDTKADLNMANRDSFIALGTGQDIALVLHNAGATHKDIIDYCIKHDYINCGGPMQYIDSKSLKPFKVNLKEFADTDILNKIKELKFTAKECKYDFI